MGGSCPFPKEYTDNWGPDNIQHDLYKEFGIENAASLGKGFLSILLECVISKKIDNHAGIGDGNKGNRLGICPGARSAPGAFAGNTIKK